MPSFPWNVGDRAESNLSPGGFADSDSERSYATVGEVRAPQWVQWFTTLSSRQNPGPSRPRLNRIASEEPSQRSTVLSAGQASSPSGIGSLQEEEWSPDQVVWQGNEAPKAPKLYSPWHQHVQQNPISTTYGTSRWTQGSTTYGTPNRMQHRMPMQSSQSQETLLPEKVPKKKRDTECMCLAVVTLLVFLTVLGTPLSLWLYFKFVVNEPIYGIDASMRITNWQFTDDLGQKGSGSFGNYSDSLCSELKDTFALGGTSLALDTCEISNFSNGSVVAEFKIGRYVVEGINENELKANLSQLLSEAVTTGKINGHRAMKSIEIDPSSLKFMDDDENECEIGDDLCAPHQCVNMLFDFMCQCQSGFIHQDDKKHACIRDERDIETTVTTTTVSSTTTAKITTEARPATNETDDCPEVKLSVHESSTTLRATCKSMDTSSNIEWLTSDKKKMTEVEDSCVKYAYFDPMNYADYLEANNDDGEVEQDSEEDKQGSGEVEQNSEEDKQGSGEMDVEDVAEGVTVTPILVTEENKESVEESEASGENLGNNGNPGNSENNGNSGNNGNNGNSGNNGNNGNSGNNGNNGNSENNGNNGNSENNGNS
ncbi:hypothetical protein CAPTEDRAFT_194197 [Capitella teleta]|uniref:SEA domain-containing protein n=1 Tax=Capitella teleta TaxID=283909 RepID=R7T8T7_CAPTE|nr:hypothetical protein CAPTEDRAFT_194197 [Capitella teleta]|eukprot:ELT87414.1 hypothetical protein CAPTEDRAFT_194197 [Capitella teleta]